MAKCVNFLMNAMKYVYRDTNNTVMSPVSLELLLFSLIPGTNGFTYEEIRENICDERPANNQAINEIITHMRDLVNYLKSFGNGGEMRIHNFFYLSTKYQLIENYMDFVSYYLDTKFKVVNFDDDTLELYNIIDAQVSAATMGRIRQVIKNVPTVSTMLIVNSNTFHGELKYYSGQSYSGKFNTEFDVQYHVFNGQMMVCQKPIAGSVACFEMPYTIENLGLFIILPKEGAIREVINALNGSEVRSMFSSLAKKKMEIHMPALPILKQNVDLVYVFQLIGLQRVLEEERCDLSRMVSNPKGLYLESILTNNEVQLNRDLSEKKSNSSGVSKMQSSAPSADHIINRPFIFFVTCNTKSHSKVLAFSGVVNSIETY